LGTSKQSREIRNAKDLLPVNFLCLADTPPFSKAVTLLRLEGTIHLTKNAVYERMAKSEKWLCENIFRRSGLGGEKP
jgi:hypothetical protein